MRYIADFTRRHSEEDSFKEGCLPDTGISIDINIRLEAESIHQLIEKVTSYFDVDHNALLFNSCDEVGRLDVQVYERSHGGSISRELLQPDSSFYKAWKAGEIKMLLCTYTATVSKLETVNLRNYGA